MKRTKQFESLAHLLLITVFVFGGVVFMTNRYNPLFQFLIVLTVSTFYFAWGCYFHHLKRDLNTKVMLEYFLIFGIVVIGALLVFF